MTTCGFWLVDAESRKTSGRPRASDLRIGKSRRMTSGSSLSSLIRPPNSVAPADSSMVGDVVTGIGSSPASAGGLHWASVRPVGVALEIGALRHEERLVRDVRREAGLAEDRAVALA